MKTLVTKFSSAVLLLLLSFNLNAQDFQGQAIYQTKTSMDMSGWGGGQMSEQQKKQIAERMKSMLEKTYVLNFNRSESTYKEEDKLAAPGSGGSRWGGMMSSFTGGPQYKNIKEALILQEQEFFGKSFLVKDSLPKLEWKLGSESKQIGQYTCFKATTTKPVDEMDFMSMRRRGRGNDEKNESEESTDSTKTDSVATDSTTTKSENIFDGVEVPKFVVVTAWYTPQIPVSTGPGEYHGLPGLILEVTADKTVMLCTKIIMNPKDKAEIQMPDKGEIVTRDEYNKIMKDKIEEMREMYGGRGRGRRN
ncbi:GLPGLI family protein [Formosa sp. Hel1_31_208]|uniref:GLPGLI family protein n=1 Tax=Formosa sp. Hel1_31_208 TaxID=1798225 RepID=UPI00087DEC2F|nr:GLPGLI family protein [Formosa sp. Hel1_31_208]SDR66487.1 GLPGLI family protein [Formosa sp. Hel1_31_208]